MTYILHMMGGRDIEMSDEEYAGIKAASKNQERQVIRKSNQEIITLSMISNTEKVVEPPEYNPNAVDDFMERQRKKNNPKK